MIGEVLGVATPCWWLALKSRLRCTEASDHMRGGGAQET